MSEQQQQQQLQQQQEQHLTAMGMNMHPDLKRPRLESPEGKAMVDWTAASSYFPQTPQTYSFMPPHAAFYTSTPMTGMSTMPGVQSFPMPFMSPADAQGHPAWPSQGFFPQQYMSMTTSAPMMNLSQQSVDVGGGGGGGGGGSDDSATSNESGIVVSPPSQRQNLQMIQQENDDEDSEGEEDGLHLNTNLATFLPKSMDPNRLQEPFMDVPGRLNVMNFHHKYTVTIGEIYRRVQPPECLNSSILGAILRKAKTKKGGSDMREELASRGITLPPGRRKGLALNSFTALIEEEAARLGTDMDDVVQRAFPCGHIAVHLKRKTDHGGHHLVQQKIRDIEGFVRIMNEFKQICNEVQSPLANSCPPQHHDADLQLAFNNFSLLSHGLGPMVMRTAAIAFEQTANMYRGALESPFQQAAPQMQRHL